MAELFNIQLESDLSEFTSTVTDSGDLSWSADAALAGTSGGMACLIDDTTSIYGYVAISQKDELRCRFYFDPQTLTMPADSSFMLCGVQARGGGYHYFVQIDLVYRAATNYGLKISARNDDGSIFFADELTSLSDEQHYIEYHVIQAATDSSNDGYAEWWLDGVSQGSDNDGDNNAIMAYTPWCYLGVLYLYTPSTPIGGTIYLDEFVANDDGVTWAIATGQEPEIWPEDEIE